MEDMEDNEQVKYLMGLEQPEQRSPEWFAARKDRLTSSDVDTVLGQNKYSKPVDVLFKKCGLGKPFEGNVATRYGQKYEDEAIGHYCRLYNKRSYSFGLLPHPTISWLGGSPDDITHDGIVIEVKCPLYRKITMGEYPKHYEAQVRMNMEICNLDRAVFIEYKPPSTPDGDDMILNVVEFTRDPEWFESVYPILESFWNEVLHYRSVGIEKHPMYEYYRNLNYPKVLNVVDLGECDLKDSDTLVNDYESE